MNIKHKISIFFFITFIFLLPWQARLILFPVKSEFLGFSIYLSEIFLWLALALWFASGGLKKIKASFVSMLFCLFVFLSVLWSPDKIAAFRIWFYVFEGALIYFYLKNFTLPLKVRGGWGELWDSKSGLIYVFLTSLFIASVFGIWQFFNLGSPAWKWLGLAARGAWNLGDIVVQTDGARFLRAYGPFPHPNIFGGYLAAGILLLLHLKNKLYIMTRPRHNIYFYIFGGVFFLALFLTFSRSAWLALATAMIYFIIKNSRKDILKFFVFLSALAIIFSAIFAPFVKTRVGAEGRLEQKSNTERIASWRDGLAVWKQNPFFGAGAGVFARSEATKQSQEKRDRHAPTKASGLAMTEIVEPPHNIFILVLSQLGLVGFAIYLFLWRGFWKSPALRPLLILFFAIGMPDHYLWTLYSGSMLFWLGLSFFDEA